MKNKLLIAVESSYRTFYGKLFSALFKQFGAGYVNEIEDAIQNAFYKSLKSWKLNRLPDNKENWLYVVARNDVLNQIKKQKRDSRKELINVKEENKSLNEDLRLKTILFLSKSKKVSAKVKVVFILKNIFGLHIKEISDCTLISQEAIYKSINRAKKDVQATYKEIRFDRVFEQASKEEIAIVEEILYAVFNIGFDSFNEKTKSIINEDLCLEALALAKMLLGKYRQNTTKNLLALFCFHLARIPEKVKDNKIVSFFEQDKTKWSSQFVTLGFHYLEKPTTLNKYYIESLITSKHMTAVEYNVEHWNEIIKLYKLLLEYSNSPFMKLNLCYCLSRAKRTKEAIELLNEIERELPNGHIYFPLVKANILNNDSTESEELVNEVLTNIKQKIRREYILDLFGGYHLGLK